MGFRGPQVQILSPRLLLLLSARHWLPLSAPAHVPLMDRLAPSLVVEADQKQVVVLAHLLGFGRVLEVAAPSMCDREVTVDGDRLIASLVCAGPVLALEPRSDYREPAADRFLERMVLIGRVLGEEITDRVWVVGLPRPNIGGKPGADPFYGHWHNEVESNCAGRTGS